MCLYDGTAAPVLAVTIPPGGICNLKSKRACWKNARRGFSYRNSDRTLGGIQVLDLRDGLTENAARIALRGRGPLLGMPSLLGLGSPLTLQLQASNGECWESVYSTPASRRSVKSLVDKAD